MTDIAKTLLKIRAVDLNTTEGFVYASGRKGPIYCDNRLILSYPKEREHIVDAFVQLIKEKNLSCDTVAGVATGAIAWGVLVAEKLGKPFVYVRPKKKDHGKQNEIEGELEEGKNVVVIEDLINSGGSSVSACMTLKEMSCTVSACLAIFNYSFDEAAQKFMKENIPLYSLSNFNKLLTAARETKFINEDDKKSLLKWHKNPGEWAP